MYYPSYLHIQVDVDSHNTEFQVSSNHREDVGGDGLFQQIRAKLLSYNFLLPRLRPPQSSWLWGLVDGGRTCPILSEDV